VESVVVEVPLDPHKIGLAMFILGALDVVLAELIPALWLNLAASPSAEITSFPLLAASPDPAATYLQAVFVGVILVVGGARIYSQRTQAAKGLLLSSLAVLFMLSAMTSFTYRSYDLSLVSLLLAVMFFVM
jgi:hypothetical protein